MKISIGYRESAFTREQVDRIGRMLGLDNHFAACSVAAKITGTLQVCMMQEVGRCAVPDVKAAKRRLERIATLSAQLSNLMEEEPLAIGLIKPPGDLMDRADADGGINMSRIRAENQKRHIGFISTLGTISSHAEKLSVDDHAFRLWNWLPPVEKSGSATLTVSLWPTLFKIWIEAGKKLAQTPHGPLHRFIELVHEAVGAPEPNPSTFRDAVVRWSYDGDQAEFADDPL